MLGQGNAATNGELVQALKEGGFLSSDAIATALRACPRDAFLPEAYREEAFLDMPLRIEEHEFNVSAPHIHATCLEALELAPGMSVLDVGSGCGLVSAACALLVGRQGSVLGIDVRKEAVVMAEASLRTVTAANPE